MLLLVFSIPVILLLSLLLAEVLLIVDTENSKYGIRFGRLISCHLVQKAAGPCLRFRFLFVSFDKRLRVKNTDSAHTPARKPLTRRNVHRLMNLLKAAGHSFTIIRLRASIDTGDYPLNARLYPLTWLVSGQRIALDINFENRNQLDCLVQTRLIRILWNLLFN